MFEIETTKEERANLRIELEELKKEIQAKFIEQNTARLNVIQAQERKEEAASGYDILKKEEQEIDQSIIELTSQKNDVLVELESSEILEKESEKKILHFQVLLEEERIEETKQTSKTAEITFQNRFCGCP